MFPIELSFLIQNRAIFRTLNCRKKKVTKIVHQDVKARKFAWKVCMTLEVKTYWSFFLGILQTGMSFDRKKSFNLKVLIPCTVTKLFENRPKNNKTAVRRF